MRKALLIIGVILICIAIPVVIYTVGRPFAKMDADFRNDIKQEYMVQDARSRTQNYEWFYEQYETIKATAMKVELSEEPERNSIKMVLTSMISEYNARSRQQMTRAKWKSDTLPYQIDINDLLGD